jgi:hypothetical protein
VWGGATLAAAKTFRRTHFAWEGCTYGLEHKVYAPFEPVRVDGRTVTVVGRTYTLNAQGLFDSVVSQGRELLAAPMQFVVELADGRRVQWREGARWFSRGVRGAAPHPDLARFETAARTDGFLLTGVVAVEEDGCARIALTLTPEGRHLTPVRRVWLEIALKDAEVPLCHLVGMNSMRHNYAGAVPRGGTVTWIQQPWRPARFAVEPFAAGQTPDSYEVWDATKNMHWGGQRWNFAPYVWLGAEERGLAWFGDHTGGYVTESGRGIQRLAIEPGRVVLRVELIQRPVALREPHTFEFGLQASPTKPMRPDWRGHTVPGGGGMSVVVWGGFNCADKVPANQDWTIVDKVMEGAHTGKPDYAWFAEYAKTHTTIVNDGGGAKPGTLRRVPLEQAKANGQPWLTALNHFVGRAAALRPGEGITVYYEEHQTNGAYPEVAEFMDEWSDGTWARYRYFEHPRTWGPEIRSANPASYRDFAVFHANEWMRRGVGIYYDNTYPMTDYNRVRLRDRGLAWSSSLWGHRDYYKRVWKRSRELMLSGESPRPLHTVGHVTNCQVLPYTTWWDATLGVESPGHWLPDEEPTAEQRRKTLDEWGFLILPTPQKGKSGTALPYPPDYLRAMECGRMAGLTPHYRHALRGEDAFGGLGIGYGATDRPESEIIAHRQLSDKAMGLVHEIRGGGSPYDHDGIRTLLAAFAEFGYGRPGVRVHNYWDNPPFLKTDNPAVTWIALARETDSGLATRDPRPATATALVLLQSYAAAACETRLVLPPGTTVLDLFSRRLQNAAEPIAFPADYGTRLLLLGPPPALAPLAWADDVLLQADFEFGLPPGWRSHGGGAPRIVADSAAPGNHVLRIAPGHPSQNFISGTARGDYELSFRFRLPPLAAKPPHREFYGFLQLLHRQAAAWPKQTGQTLALGIGLDADAMPALAVRYGVRRDGQEEAFSGVTSDRLNEAGRLVPLGTGWHTVRLAVRGTRHTLSLDGLDLFSGETDVSDGGALVLGPGWSSWADGIPFVEVDDLVCRRPAGP